MSTDRYLRHSVIDWFDQEMVANASVVVVGVGAVGNEVLKNLCLLGIGHIHIVDYDRIELHNLTRTVLFTEADVGHYKAEAAASSCNRIDPNIDVTYAVGDFWKSLTIEKLRDCSAVFCCVDNFEARIRLNQLCLLAKTDFYNTAIDSRFVTVERYPFGTHRECACYECNLPVSVYARIGERYSCGWLKKRAFEEKKIPTTIITSSIAGAGVCSLYLHKLPVSSPVDAIRCYLDTISLNSTVSVVERTDNCPACSRLPKEFHYFKVKNVLVPSILRNRGLSEDLTIWLSDRVILDITCVKCGNKKIVNDLVDKYDDAILYCDRCNMRSNNVTIKDNMSLSRFEDIFRTSQIPVKYLHFHVEETQFLLEMEV